MNQERLLDKEYKYYNPYSSKVDTCPPLLLSSNLPSHRTPYKPKLWINGYLYHNSEFVTVRGTRRGIIMPKAKERRAGEMLKEDPDVQPGRKRLHDVTIKKKYDIEKHERAMGNPGGQGAKLVQLHDVTTQPTHSRIYPKVYYKGEEDEKNK